MRTSFRAALHAPLLFLRPPVCVPPLRAKQRGGGTPPLGLGVRPGSLAPFAHTRGTWHCFHARAASHSHAAPALKPGGGGGARLPGLRASPVACRPARKAEGGWCRLRVCPLLVRLAHKRGRPRSPSTCPLFARRLCAETQAGGRGFACGPQFARPFCVQPGARRFPFPRGRSFACRPCAQTGGGGGPAAPLLGLGVALARRRRVREGEGEAKGGGFPFPHGPVLATPSQSLLRTNGAYRATCRFWVRSRIKTSVRGCTSTSRAGLKTDVSGIDSIETRRSYMCLLDTEVNGIR